MIVSHFSGIAGDKNDEKSKSKEDIGGHSGSTTSNVLRMPRLDDSGNDSGHNSIMTSKYANKVGFIYINVLQMDTYNKTMGTSKYY